MPITSRLTGSPQILVLVQLSSAEGPEPAPRKRSALWVGPADLVLWRHCRNFGSKPLLLRPKFGRSPGGQVILTTRSGTNDFHGGIYEYFRNTVMDANNWFNNEKALPRAPEHHNDFGGFLGGPIWKDKTFFFVSYEGARLQLPNTQVIQVPSVFARMQASSTLAPFLSAYPQPNGPPTSQYIAPLRVVFLMLPTWTRGACALTILSTIISRSLVGLTTHLRTF